VSATTSSGSVAVRMLEADGDERHDDDATITAFEYYIDNVTTTQSGISMSVVYFTSEPDAPLRPVDTVNTNNIRVSAIIIIDHSLVFVY
jgi:hypothetical protein